MAITRIKNNQITDSTIVASSKVQGLSITSGLLENDLTYGSNLTVTGNLTVNGTTTTINTTNTSVEDPIMVLASQQAGAGAVDIGFIGERGTDTNIAFVWDESADEFVAGFTNDADSSSTVLLTGFANVHVNNIIAEGTFSAPTGETTLSSATVSDLTDNRIVIAGVAGSLEDDINFTMDGTTFEVGTAFDLVVASGNLTTTGTIDTGAATLDSATISDLTDNRILIAGVAGAVEDSAALTFDGTTF